MQEPLVRMSLTNCRAVTRRHIHRPGETYERCQKREHIVVRAPINPNCPRGFQGPHWTTGEFRRGSET